MPYHVRPWVIFILYSISFFASAFLASAVFTIALIFVCYNICKTYLDYLPLLMYTPFVIPVGITFFAMFYRWNYSKPNILLLKLLSILGMVVFALGLYAVVVDPEDVFISGWLLLIGPLIALPGFFKEKQNLTKR